MVRFKDEKCLLLAFLLVLLLVFNRVSSFALGLSDKRSIPANCSKDSSVGLFHEMVSQSLNRSAQIENASEGFSKVNEGSIIPSFSNLAKNNDSVPLSRGNSASCVDNFEHLLLLEDSTILSANFITKTRDGHFLIPGYYHGNNGIYYNMPYLIKCTNKGDIVWSKSYPNRGIFSSKWFTAGRIKELHSGDLLMVGQIGVPGTDDRRELAVWRFDKNGNLIWGESYESILWTDPITGSTEITGIQEDSKGDIFLSGNLRFFEASKFAFVLKMDSKGKVLWDKNYSTSNPLAYGLLLIQEKLLLVGGSGPFLVSPNLNANILWCISMNPENGDTISTKAWYANFGQQSFANSFAYANTTVGMLDNGQISVFGTANSDYLAYVGQKEDTIHHGIIANFSPDFDFLTGIMLGSKHATNYYNTVTTQHPNGRISFTRFSGNDSLYNEDIIYGSIQNFPLIREKIYHEQNRSSATVSNFLFYEPDEDIVIQAYIDSTNRKGGLEMIRLYDTRTSDYCSGSDTNLTFVQPYFMTMATLHIDRVLTTTIQQTKHNFVSASKGNLTKMTGCHLIDPSVHSNPVISLNKDSFLCRGSIRQLTPGSGYSKYLWSDGSTNSSLFVSDTGKYWVSVTDQNGCMGSDTTTIFTVDSLPSAFLPNDTSICQTDKLTIIPLSTYQSYLWSDLSNDQTLTVSQPGSYWLQVTDGNNCVGRDTLKIAQMHCLKELLVPNAFTPNGDGRNDIFRPLVLGNIIKFRFTIYNRWGEKVFETQTPQRGWDGKVKGISANNGVFAWYCQYQLAGQPEKIEKGTVILIR